MVSSARIRIVVQVKPARLSYSSPVSTYPVADSPSDHGEEDAGSSVVNNSVKTIQGSHLLFSIHPELPVGLTLSPSDGTIAGRPAAPSPRTIYRVTASNRVGHVVCLVEIQILARPAPCVYEQRHMLAVRGEASAANPRILTNSQGKTRGSNIQTAVQENPPSLFFAIPKLPLGLELELESGCVLGTPQTTSLRHASFEWCLSGPPRPPLVAEDISERQSDDMPADQMGEGMGSRAGSFAREAFKACQEDSGCKSAARQLVEALKKEKFWVSDSDLVVPAALRQRLECRMLGWRGAWC